MKKNGIKSAVTTTGQGLWTRMPMWAKGIVIVGGLYVVYKVGKTILKTTKLDPEVRDDKQEVDGWNKDLINESASKKPTLTTAQMKQIANKIENCLDGYGTRDYDLKQTFKQIKNNADFAGVNVAFGTRTIEAGQGIGWMWGGEKGTLTQVIQEADSATLVAINKDLASRGIKYKV
jgi:hypothetical protein